jgi:uncharacterized membrane protein
MQASTTRVETFSDAVMAIIITIMVLEIKLPEFNVNHSDYDIKKHLIDLLPNIGAYVFSFIMIGILWLKHHHLFHLLEKTDNFLLGQNLFFLFWVSLIPFVTGIMGVDPLIPLSTALYGLIMLMTTLTLSLMVSYTLKNKLIHTDEKREIKIKISTVIVKGMTKSFIGSVIYLASVPLAFVSVYASYACFIIPIILFLWPSGIDEEKLANKVIEKNR